jgi:hypothetical protein
VTNDTPTMGRKRIPGRYRVVYGFGFYWLEDTLTKTSLGMSDWPHGLQAEADKRNARDRKRARDEATRCARS